MTNSHGIEIATRLVLLRDYFCANASETRAVKMSQIVDYLASVNLPLSRKMIYTYINALSTDFNLAIEYSGKYRGYVLHNAPWEPYELRLMVESIQASKFITEPKAKEITEKIKNLMDVETRQSFSARTYVPDRVRSMNDSVVKEAVKLHTAISTDHKVSFKYFHYTPFKDKPKRYSNDGAPYVISAFAMSWNNGNYYLYGYDGEIFRYFRIDRMERITVLEAKREGKEQYKSSALTAHQKSKVFNSYGGSEYKVCLQCANSLVDQIIDQFGKDNVMMIPKDEETFTVNVFVQVSPTFYAWVSTFMDKMKILSPAPVVQEYIDFLRKSLNMYKDDSEM